MLSGKFSALLVSFSSSDEGPPQPSFEVGTAIGLEPGTTLPNGKKVAENNRGVLAKKHLTIGLSRLGLSFVLAGFVVQLIASLPAP